MTDKKTNYDHIVSDIMADTKKAPNPHARLGQDKIPMVLDGGKVVLVDVDDLQIAVEKARSSVSLSVLVAGKCIMYDTIDPISGNRYQFYSDRGVITMYDMTVVVISEQEQIIKVGTVGELCAQSFAFSRFMQETYNNFCDAFNYPTITEAFEWCSRNKIVNFDNSASWQPLLNGTTINENGDKE